MTPEPEKRRHQKLADLVPTNWLDPILTGPKAVLRPGVYRYRPADIERVLNAVRERIEKAEDPQKEPVVDKEARS